MKFERNNVIGFIVLAILFFAFFYYNSKEQNRFLAEKKQKEEQLRVQDSTKRAQDSILNYKTNPQPGTTAQPVATAADSVGLLQSLSGTEATTEVNTDLMKVVFTNHGGQLKGVELKGFKGPDGNDVKMAASDSDKINYNVAVAPNRSAGVAGLYFAGAEKTESPDSTIVSYKLHSAEGHEIVHRFVVKPHNYMIDFTILVNGVQQLLGSNVLNLTWQNHAIQQQKDITYERGQSKVGYRFKGDFDNHIAPGGGSKEFTGKVDWVGVKQQFFNTTLVSKTGFSGGNLIWSAPADSSKTVVQATANMQVPLQNTQTATVPLSLYFGPNDYKVLKQYGNDMEDMVDLGSGIFAFVKYINRWIVIPAFNFFSSFTKNYGIVILLLTLLIRLVISPLTYSSYLSGAKMKVLRPEIDQLKAKYGSDQQAMSMEQMKLFREAGVNPLGGCIPALFQIPIFFALYSFFNSNVALRGQGFLWANDLSQYDSIFHLPFTIPLYGDHVSLFTITAVTTSFLISLYSMASTPDQGNPVLKYMPYFFPFVLLFVFNKLPAGLTWYYTVSNIITLALQFVIQTYIINHDKILARMEENRKKPKTKSKWQERLEQMQDQQKQIQQQQKRK
ncbi:membrane protein insertase YidC [Flavisolibacter nicotianae]|uniref:membrane protein insertase YidC n=1 Tax=Flavisolibacter nicotianae TaxID=2364882 RepID=UPI000EAB9775|nr:membrane protein insertase YidC [Flavisolibacter nicotianae]